MWGSILTFCGASDLKFCPHSYSCCVRCMMYWNKSYLRGDLLVCCHQVGNYVGPPTGQKPGRRRVYLVLTLPQTLHGDLLCVAAHILTCTWITARRGVCLAIILRQTLHGDLHCVTAHILTCTWITARRGVCLAITLCQTLHGDLLQQHTY